jgi:hypothetical protein
MRITLILSFTIGAAIIGFNQTATERAISDLFTPAEASIIHTTKQAPTLNFEAIDVSLGTIREVSAEVTAYSEFDSCHTGKSCLMASGKKAYVGAVACPRNIAIGTRVIIDNTPYICEDRTALRLDGRYDIFMGYGRASYNKAINYGKQIKKITLE